MRIFGSSLCKNVEWGFTVFSRCLHCSKSITSHRSVLRLGGWGVLYIISLVSDEIRRLGVKIFGDQGPSRGLHENQAGGSMLSDTSYILLIVCHNTLY